MGEEEAGKEESAAEIDGEEDEEAAFPVVADADAVEIMRLDIIFVCDTTGSMGTSVRSLANTIKQVSGSGRVGSRRVAQGRLGSKREREGKAAKTNEGKKENGHTVMCIVKESEEGEWRECSNQK